jgi:hypothetical protein
LTLTALLERLQFQLRATETSTWWASNGRDVVNAFALGTMSIGLRVIGFTGPIALSIAATVVVVLSVVQTTFEKHPLSSWTTIIVALGLGTPVLLVPAQVHQVFRTTIELLF